MRTYSRSENCHFLFPFALIAVLVIAFSNLSNAATKTWVGASGASWLTAASWSPAVIPATGDDIVFNNATAMSVTSVPTLTVNSITLNGAGNVTLSGISTAKTLSITSYVMVNDGNLVVGGLMSYSFLSTATYNHVRDGGTIPTATWATGSTVNITGTNATVTTSSANSYSNFILNAPGQVNLAGATTIAGTLTLTNGVLNINAGQALTLNGTLAATGAGTISSATATTTLAIGGTTGGNFGTLRLTGGAQTVGTFTVSRTGTTPSVDLGGDLTVQTTLNLTSGTVNASTGSLILGNGTGTLTTTRTNGTLNLTPTFNLSGVIYNVAYGISSPSNTTGPELPPVGSGIVGTLTNGNTVTGGTKLGADVEVNNFTLTTGTFDLNGFTMKVGGAFTHTAGTFTANATTSTLEFNGSVAQALTIGTYTGTIISNLVVNNTLSTGATPGFRLGNALTVNNLTVGANSILNLNGQTLTVRGAFGNDGTIVGTSTASNITMNGSTAQTIDGTGTYSTVVNPITPNGALAGLTINNTAGVSLDQDLTLQNALTLTAGALDGTGTLTFGTGSGTLVITRTLGSLILIPLFDGVVNGTLLNMAYGSGAAITLSTGNELPDASVASVNTFTLNVAAAGNVTLTKNLIVNSTWTHTNGIFTIGANQLALNGVISYTAGSFVGGASTDLTIGGTGSPTFPMNTGVPGTSNLLRKLAINKPSGTVTFSTATIVNDSLFLMQGVMAATNSLTLNGAVQSTGGTLSGTGALVFGGNADNIGTINLTSGAQSFTTLTFNNQSTVGTTASPTLTINGNLTLTTAANALVMNGNSAGGGVLGINGTLALPSNATFSLANGIVSMGNNSVTYTNTVATAASLINSLNTGNAKGYFAFLGANGGFQLSQTTAALNSGLTLNFPIGPLGSINSYRPVTLVTNATTNIVVSEVIKFGYVEQAGGTSYSPANVPTVDGSSLANTRSNIILNITVSGTVGTTGPHLTMTYQNSDFNTPPSSAGAVKIWRHNGYWTDQSQTSNGTSGSNITITKTSFPLTAAGAYPLNLAETNNDVPVTNTWTWVGGVSGLWNNAANWSPNSVPNATTANVIINNPSAANQPTLNGSYAVNNITIASGCTLTQNAVTLTVYGDFTNNGDLNLAAPTTAATINYAGAVTQLVAPGNYFNLTSSSTGVRTLSPTGTINIAGTFTKGTNSFTTTGSTVNFAGGTAQSIPALAYNNLSISMTGAFTASAAGALSIDGNLTLNNGTLADAGNVITGPGTGTGTFTIVGSSTFTTTTTNANPMPVFQSYNFSPTSIVNFNGLAAQNLYAVTAPGYGHLNITATSAANAKTAAGSFIIQGNLTVNSSSALYDGGNVITANGNITNNGTINGAAGSAGSGGLKIANGTATHTITSAINGAVFGNIEIDDASFGTTMANTTATTGNTNIMGNVTVTNGTLSLNNFTTAVTISGTTSISGTLTIGTATGTKNFNNLIVNNGGTFTSSAVIAITVSGDIENNGTFNASTTGAWSLTGAGKEIRGSNPIIIANTVSITNTTGYTNKTDFTVNALAGAGKITNFTNANLIIGGTTGSLTTTTVDFTTNIPNTVTYAGTGAQAVRGGTTYNNLTIDKTAGTATVSTAAITINGNFLLNSGAFADGAFAITGPGTGTGKSFTINGTATYTSTYANANPIPVFDSYSLSPTSSMAFNANFAQNIPVALSPYGNLSVATGGIKTAAGDIFIAGNLSASTSTYNIGANYTTTVEGTLTGTTISGASGTTSSLILSGTTNTNLPTIANLLNLTINKQGGTVTANATNTVAGTLYLTDGVLAVTSTLTLTGSISSASGTVSGTGSLVLGGTAGGNMGTINLTGGAQNFTALTFSRSGTTPSVTINGNITLTGTAASTFLMSSASGTLNINGNLSIAGNVASIFNMNASGGVLNMGGNITLSGTTTAIFALNNGIINMGDNAFTYNSTGANIPASTELKYVSFNGPNGGFVWNMPSGTAAGTYRLPIGVAGNVNGFRPITLQTLALTSGITSIKAGFINHDGSGVVSGTEVPTTGNNRAGYIANISVLSGTLPTSNITMAYQDGDFNGGAPLVAEVAVYRFNGTAWSRLGSNSNATANGNTTITKNGITLSGNQPYILGITGGSDLPGNAYVWTGATSTAWEEPTNWDLNNGAFPNDPADNVIINISGGNQPIIPNGANYTVKDLEVSNGAVLTVGNGTAATLTIYGVFTNTATLNGGTNSTVSFASNLGQTIPQGNYFNLIGNGGTGARTLSPTGVVAIAGTFTPGSNTYTVTGSTINFNSNVTQSLPTIAFVYDNLILGGGGVKSLLASMTVNGNLTIENGTTFQDGSGTNTLLITGPGSGSGKTFTINGTGIFNMYTTNANPLPVFQNYVFSASSTVRYGGANAQTISSAPSPYGDLIISSTNTTAYTKTANGPFTVAGSLNLATSTVTFANGGNIITVNGNLTSTGAHTGAGKILLSGGSATHTLSGTGAHTGILELNDANGAILASNTGTLSTLNIVAGTFTVPAYSITVTGLTVDGTIAFTSATGTKSFTNVLVNAGGTWDNGTGNAAVGIAGNLQNDGTFTAGTGTYTLSGASKTITGTSPLVFNNLTVNNTYTSTADVTVLSAFAGSSTYTNGSNASLTLGGTATITNLNASANSNTVTYNGTVLQTVKAPVSSIYHHLIINNAAGANNGAAVTVNGTLTLQNGAFGIGNFLLTLAGDLAQTGGTLTGGTGSSLSLTGSGSNITLPAIANHLLNLTINRTAGVTLGAPLEVGTATTGTLTLTSGILATTSTNTLTVKNTNIAGVSGGSTSSYVNGPLTLSLPASGAGSPYNFPVGKSAFNRFELLNTGTNAAGTVTVEVFDAPTGGTAGFALSNLNTNRYWTVQPSGSFITGANVRLTEPTIGSGNRVAQSSTLTGTYVNRGGTAPSPILSGGVDPAMGYFAIGVDGPITLNGTYPVGNSSNFIKLTDVANALNSATVTGNVIFELQADYDGTVGEAFPINFSPFTTSGGSWYATVRPAAGVSTRTTSGDGGSGTANIVFNGVDRITFDGRAGGTGSTIAWIIRNTRTASTVGPTILLTNGAQYDKLAYLQVEGQSSVSTLGTIQLNSVTSASNTYDTIQNCYITRYASGTTSHVNAIHAYGSTAQPNSYIWVMNNQISNFSPTSTSNGSGVLVTGTGLNTNYGDNWTISGNSFFFDYTTQMGTSQLYPINILAGTGSNNHIITNNYIGGTEANCGGNPWTVSSTSSAGMGTPCFAGIYLWAGSATVTGNTIGNIRISNSNNNGHAFGINISSGGNNGFNVTGNTIGLVNPVSPAVGFINVGTGANGGSIAGIVNQGPGNVNLSSNTIANLSNTNGSVNAPVAGIVSVNGLCTLNDNTIYGLSAATSNNASQVNSLPFDGSIVGILNTSGNTGSFDISRNTLYDFNNTLTSASATKIYGIRANIQPNSGGTSYIDRNLVYALSAPNGNTSINIYGIALASSSNAVTVQVSNNMVALGRRIDGSSITSSANLTGIWDNASGYITTNLLFYHNSVYIGGDNVVGGSIPTYAIRRQNTNSSPKDYISLKNNIFVNDRKNVSGTAAHFGIGLDNNTNITASDYNLVYGSGSTFNFGQVASTAYATKSAWTGANGWDGNSPTSDPKFINATAATPNLHIQAAPVPTPIEAAGDAATTVAQDFDGEIRSNYTPVDIGADAGDYEPSDLTPPNISYTPAADACNGTTTYTFSGVSITDGSGIINGGPTAPRVYYKKASDATNNYLGNTSATAGWKYVLATGSTSPFSFDLDFTKLSGGANPGDVIQYFVVAQDASPNSNVGINSGTFNTTPISTDLTTTQFPIAGTINSFSILPCSGTVTVGTGGNYLSLTNNNSGGIFRALNATTLTGPLTVQIISDLGTEDGAVTLGAIAGNSSTNTVTFVPVGGTRNVYSVSAVGANGMVPLSANNYVTFDGGSSKQLVFRNNFSSQPVVQFYNGASNYVFTNCIIEGNNTGTSSGAVLFGTGTATSGVTFSNNEVKPSSGNTYANGIYNATATNASNTIIGNSIYDFTNAGISFTSNTGNGWTVTNNHFYRTTTATAAQTGIAILGGSGHTITGNFIGGSAANASGTAWTNSGAVAVTGISLTLGTASASTVQDNTIANFNLTSTGAASFTGINITAGSYNPVLGNTIGSATAPSSIQIAGTGSLIGIRSTSSNGITISGNSILNLANNNTSSGQLIGIQTTAGANTITVNTIGKLSSIVPNTGTGISASVIGMLQSSTSGAQNITGNNVYGLANNASTAAVVVTGIAYSGTAGTTNNITANTIHSFKTVSTSASAEQQGINMVAGGATVANNMIRLGLDTAGNTISASNILTGINLASTGTVNTYFNSVYIGGTPTTGSAANTFALRGTATSGTWNIRNNIFANDRTGGPSGSTHLAISLQSVSPVSGIDYNLYSSTDGSLFTIGGSTLAAPKFQRFKASFGAGTGQDAHSGVATLGQINYINPSGDYTNVDLHLQNPTSAADAGLTVTVGTDIDNDTRTSTPDLGADEGPFTVITNTTDVFAPALTITPLGNQSICGASTSVNLSAVITDFGTGVPTTGSNVPRIYYRRSVGSGAPTAWVSTAGVLQSGNGNNGTWQFTIDYSLLPGSVAGGDVYQYFIVAQDGATVPNIAYSTFDATTPSLADVNQGIPPGTAPNTPHSFSIVNSISGVITVGSGGTYTTFNGNSGLFYALNNGVLSGNVTVQVISDITETAYTPLTSLTSVCGGPWTLTIVPDAATVRTITGNNGQSMIVMNGVSNVLIDGNHNGSGQYLVWRNSQNHPAFWFNNGTDTVTIKNSLIESGNTNSTAGAGIIVLGGPLGVGSQGVKHITIDNNTIRNRTVGSGYSKFLILSSNVSGVNGNITITNNDMSNWSIFSGGSGYAAAIQVGTNGGGNYTISGNSMYNTFVDGTGQQLGIDFRPGTSSVGNLIQGNYIGGSAPLCGGTNAWRNNTLTDLIVIHVTAGNDAGNPTVIRDNTIQNIQSQNSDAGGITAIEIAGSTRANIIANTIGHPTLINNLIAYGGGAGNFNTGWVYGVYSSTSAPLLIDSNLIAGLASVGFYNGYGNSIEHSGTGSVTIMHNTLANSYNGGNLNDHNYLGITINGGGTGHVIADNTLSMLGTAGATFVAGIHVYNGTGTISRNKVSNLFSPDHGASAAAIMIEGSGSWTVNNNMVMLNNKSWNGTYTTRVEYYGILDWATGGTNKYYYNSVLITGSQTGASQLFPSGCFYKVPSGVGSGNGANVEVRNNIFINNRTGASKHYAIDNTTSNPSVNWSSDYNFFSTATNSTLGYWNGDRTFAAWQSNSGGDANSTWAQALTTGNDNTTNGTINPNDLFVDPANGDLHIKLTSTAAYTPYNYIKDLATTLATVTTDYDGETRPMDSAPEMGADEFVACATPTIATHPTTPTTVCEGANTSFTVGATGVGTLTYTWEVSANGGGSWSNATGGVYSNGNTATLNITGADASMNGYQYRTQVTGVCGSVTSNVATLTVNTAPTITAYNPSGWVNTICAGSNTSFGVTVTGSGTPTYQWQTLPSGGSWGNVNNGAPYSGATGSMLSINNTPSNLDGNQYRVIVTGTCGVDTSDAGPLNVSTVSITQQPATSVSDCEGGEVQITAAANIGTYQWQVSTNGGGNWNNVSNGSPYSGATSGTLVINPLAASMNGYQYRLVAAYAACGSSINSNASTLTVNATPGTITINGGGTQCGSATLVASGGTGGTIYWQGTTSGGTSTAAPGTSQTVGSSGTYFFRAQSSAGCWGPEESVTVTITPGPNSSTNWIGVVDGDWFKWQNWSNCVPGAITDVTISAGAPNYPNVYGANPVANSITIQAGGSMTLNTGRTLFNTTYINNAGTLTMTDASIIDLGTHWTNTGTFSSGDGTVKFTGTTNSTVDAGGTANNAQFNKVVVDKTNNAKVTVSTAFKSKDVLQVDRGEFEVPTGIIAQPKQIDNKTGGSIRVKSNAQLKVDQ